MAVPNGPWHSSGRTRVVSLFSERSMAFFGEEPDKA